MLKEKESAPKSNAERQAALKKKRLDAGWCELRFTQRQSISKKILEFAAKFENITPL